MSSPQNAPTQMSQIMRYIGPGLILTASIVGSGEVIATPKLAAEAGFQLLWLIVLGCIIKVFVQVELGRFAVAKGMTTLEAMDTIPGPRLIVSWLLWLWFFMYVAIVFQVAGIVGATAQVLEQGGLDLNRKLIAVLVAGVTAGLLVLGRYKLVEQVSIFMVAAFTLCTIIAVGSIQWSDFAITGAQLAEGFKFRLPDNFTTAFGAFGIIGVGASELIYYPYWVLEKGYARNVGPNDGSAEWYERARGWMKVMRVDAWVSMVVYTLATVAFFLLGAAVLHTKGLEVTNDTLIPTLAHMYRESFGPMGLHIFLLGAFFALFSTMFVATASNARLLVDGLKLFKLVNYPDEEARQRLIRICCVVLPAISVGMFMLWEKPVTLVFIGAVGQGLMLPFLAMAALYFRYKRTDAPLQPGGAWTFFLWVAAVSMIAAGIYQVVTQFLK